MVILTVYNTGERAVLLEVAGHTDVFADVHGRYKAANLGEVSLKKKVVHMF